MISFFGIALIPGRLQGFLRDEPSFQLELQHLAASDNLLRWCVSLCGPYAARPLLDGRLTQRFHEKRAHASSHWTFRAPSHGQCLKSVNANALECPQPAAPTLVYLNGLDALAATDLVRHSAGLMRRTFEGPSHFIQASIHQIPQFCSCAFHLPQF